MDSADKILIIDDEEGMRDSCSQALRRLGFQVASSPDGSDGLEQVTAFKPDLILLDLKMPGLSGMEVLERVRQIAPDTIVIVITGYPTIESAVEAIKKGAYDFLPKPFKNEELKVIVQRGIERRSLIIESALLREEKKRLEKSFMSMLSHQMRSPLSNIQQYFEVILQGFAGGITEKQREILEKQKNNVDTLLKLIESWLNLARIDKDVVKKNLEPVNVSSIFRRVESDSGPLAARENVTLAFNSLEELPEIRGIPMLLEEAFKNIVNNGIKYNRPGGTVSVSGRANKSFIDIVISDSGTGISEENLPFIFDEFFRADTGSQPLKTGFGLGLAITRKIIDAHGGSIHVTSDPGRGTSFTVLLPIG